MDTVELRRQLKRLKSQVVAFDRRAREFLGARPELSDDEYEAPTLEAIFQGTLECLLEDDLEPALQKIEELDSLLQENPGL